MGSSISAIYDSYDDYKDMCKCLNKTPVPIRGSISFYDEMKSILTEYKCETTCDFFVKMKEEGKYKPDSTPPNTEQLKQNNV